MDLSKGIDKNVIISMKSLKHDTPEYFMYITEKYDFTKIINNKVHYIINNLIV